MEAFPKQRKAWSPLIGDLCPKKQLQIPTRVEKEEEDGSEETAWNQTGIYFIRNWAL